MKTLCLNKYPFKIIKLNLEEEYYTNIDLSLLSFNESISEVFEIYIINKNYQNLKNIIPILNKIKNLKKLIIKKAITISQLIELKNVQDIEYFEAHIFIDKEDNSSFDDFDNFFKCFKNLKSVVLEINDTMFEDSSQLSVKLPYKNLPNNLKIIKFYNINGKKLKSIIERNIQNLLNIEEIKIDGSLSNMKSLLFDYFREMKNLLKLSLNDIEIKGFIYDRKKKRSKEKNVFLQYLPDIFRKIETIPTLIELDINHNFREIEESFFNSNKFKEIANNLPKQLLNLELFKDVEISNLGNYNNLV